MDASNAVYGSLLVRKEWLGQKDLALSAIIPTANEAGDIDLPLERIQEAFSGASFDGSSIEVMLAGDSTGDTPDVVESAVSLFPNLHIQLNHAPAGHRAAGPSGAAVTGLTAALSLHAGGMNGGAQRDRSLNSVHGVELLFAIHQRRSAALHYTRLLHLIGPEYLRDPHNLARASTEVRPARE